MKLLVEVLRTSDLKARLADVIWTIQRKDNFRFAELAIDYYLQLPKSRLLQTLTLMA